MSRGLLEELSGVLARPKFASAAREGRAIDLVEALRVGARWVNDPPATEAITRDPKDDYLVWLARSSAATAFVSGDLDLLEANIRDIEILSTMRSRSTTDRSSSTAST